MRARLRGLSGDRRGAVALLGVLCMTTLLGAAAIGVDLGEVFLKGRELQGVADLAAMASVQTLDPSASTTPAGAANATAAANPWPGGIIAAATPGVYTPDPSTPAAQRFTAGGAAPNAVRVTLKASAPLYFGALITGRPTLTLTRTATAARAQYAAFSIGSGLAALDGGVANAVLSALAGGQVSLRLMDYQALASAKVDLLRFMPALRTRAGLTGLSFSQVLSASVPPATALNALADTLQALGQPLAAASARQLAAASVNAGPASLSSLMDLGPYDAQDHALSVSQAALQVTAFSLAQAILSTGGAHQASLNLDSAAPGLAHLSLFLAIGQRPSHSPWLTVTDAGEVIVRTAQMRLYLQASLAPGLLPTGGALVTLPVFVEAASAQARLAAIDCPADQNAQGFQLQVSPSLGTLAIAQAAPSTLADFTRPVALSSAPLVSAPLPQASAYGRVDLGGGSASWQTVGFTAADAANATVKSVYANDIARASVASLLTNTTVNVQAGGIGLGVAPGALSPTLNLLLTQAAPALDAIIAQVELASGVRLGEADVWTNGLRCHGAALVA